MSSRTTLYLLLLAATVLMAQGCKPQDNWLFWKDPSPLWHPTALAYWPAQDALIVGSHQDGTLVLLPLDPAKAQKQFLAPHADGKYGAARVRVDEKRNRLWVLDHGALYVYDLGSLRLVKDGVFLATRASARHCLPDIALAPDGSAFISDNTRGHIYRVDGESLELAPWHAAAGGGGPGAEGFSALAVSPDGKWLLAGSSAAGELWRFDLDTRRAERLAPPGRLAGVCGLAIRSTVRSADTGGKAPAEEDALAYAALGFTDRVARIRLREGEMADVAECLGGFTVEMPTSLDSDGTRLYVTHSRLKALWNHRLSGDVPHNNLVYKTTPC